jgi:signal transduction histidine kinase
VLVAEDCEDDFVLVTSELRAGGFDVQTERVDTKDGLRRELEKSSWDIVLSDYAMPQFSALDALEIVRASRHANVPFVIVSGSIGEERAVAALREGAANYVLKNNLRSHLVAVVDRELRDAELRRERGDAVEALRRAVSARDEFLSIASHELKTPLTSLQLQVQSLLEAARIDRPLSDARVTSKLASIARSTARLAELVERLLDITRLTSGRLPLQPEEVDLSALTREVVGRLDDLFADARSTVSVDAAASVVGRWDRERLATVLANLLANAAKYGAGKEISVAVEHATDVACVRVKDRGIGISPADHERIFQRFERAVPERHYGGFGLGLWLSRQIVEAHGGKIAVESVPGEGSTFSVTLPLGV